MIKRTIFTPLLVVYIYILAIIVLLYHFFGNSVFGEEIQGWIVFATSIMFSLFLILYICIYILIEEFRIGLLLLIPTFGIQIWQIIITWHIVREATTERLIWTLATIGIVTITIDGFISFIRRNQRKIIKSDLLYTRYSRSNTDLPFELYVHNSGLSSNVSDDICYLVIKLYQYAKAERLSFKRLEDLLSRYEEILSPSIRRRVCDRFMESHYLNRMESVNLLEFAVILFPEFFGGSQKAYSSDDYNLRLFEEFYLLSKEPLI